MRYGWVLPDVLNNQIRVDDHLQCFWNPIGPLLNVDKPAVFGIFLSKKGRIHYSGPHNFFVTLAILCEGLWILLDHDSNVLQEKKLTRRQRCRLKPPQMWILSRFVFCQVGYKAKEVWQVSNWPRRLGEFWVALTIFLCAEQEDKNWFCHWSCLMQNRPNKSCLNCCLLDKCRSCKISLLFLRAVTLWENAAAGPNKGSCQQKYPRIF